MKSRSLGMLTGAKTRVKLCFGIPISTTSLIDRASRKLPVHGETTRGDYKDKTRNGCPRKNLKRLKRLQMRTACGGCGIFMPLFMNLVRRKRPRPPSGPRRGWPKCAPRISNRSAKRIKYFMENDLFNGPYGRWGGGSLRVCVDL